MNKRNLLIGLGLVSALVFGTLAAYAAPSSAQEPRAAVLVKGLEGGSGSTVGPDGALYVPETIAGRIARIDPATGEVTPFASGLPKQLTDLGIGGVMDVAFLNQTAYALVTLVASDWGGTAKAGIYRIDGPDKFTVIADLGQWSIDNPPPHYPEGYDTATGVQYSMQPYPGGFIVTDGHHNRVLKVGLDGSITQLLQLANVVPTGLALWGDTIYLSHAGHIPHLPSDGKVLSFHETIPSVSQVAAGAPLLVDVEYDLCRNLYALSQGTHEGKPGTEGSPAMPNTGSLVRVSGDGTFAKVAGELNQPTSLEFIGNTAYVVTFGGEVYKIENVSSPACAFTLQ